MQKHKMQNRAAFRPAKRVPLGCFRVCWWWPGGVSGVRVAWIAFSGVPTLGFVFLVVFSGG